MCLLRGTSQIFFYNSGYSYPFNMLNQQECWALSLRANPSGSEADNSLPSSDVDKNGWIYTSTPQYATMACKGTTTHYVARHVNHMGSSQQWRMSLLHAYVRCARNSSSVGVTCSSFRWSCTVRASDMASFFKGISLKAARQKKRMKVEIFSLPFFIKDLPT